MVDGIHPKCYNSSKQGLRAERKGPMNKGGFSRKRAVGITRAKQRFSSKTGIPLTKSGRQRKVGKAITGGGCLLAVVPAIIVVIIVAAILL